MFKFNFEKGSLDFLKTIRKRDFFTTFLFLFLVALILRDDIKEFHELRFVERLGQSFIFFDLVPETSYYKKKMEPECKNWFVSKLKKYYPDIKIVVNIDPIYAHN